MAKKRMTVRLDEQAAADLAELFDLLVPGPWTIELIVSQAIKNQLDVIKATKTAGRHINPNLRPFDPVRFAHGESWPAAQRQQPGKLLYLVPERRGEA